MPLPPIKHKLGQNIWDMSTTTYRISSSGHVSTCFNGKWLKDTWTYIKSDTNYLDEQRSSWKSSLKFYFGSNPTLNNWGGLYYIYCSQPKESNWNALTTLLRNSLGIHFHSCFFIFFFLLEDLCVNLWCLPPVQVRRPTPFLGHQPGPSLRLGS